MCAPQHALRRPARPSQPNATGTTQPDPKRPPRLNTTKSRRSPSTKCTTALRHREEQDATRRSTASRDIAQHTETQTKTEQQQTMRTARHSASRQQAQRHSTTHSSMAQQSTQHQRTPKGTRQPSTAQSRTAQRNIQSTDERDTAPQRAAQHPTTLHSATKHGEERSRVQPQEKTQRCRTEITRCGTTRHTKDEKTLHNTARHTARRTAQSSKQHRNAPSTTALRGKAQQHKAQHTSKGEGGQ